MARVLLDDVINFVIPILFEAPDFILRVTSYNSARSERMTPYSLFLDTKELQLWPPRMDPGPLLPGPVPTSPPPPEAERGDRTPPALGITGGFHTPRSGTPTPRRPA